MDRTPIRIFVDADACPVKAEIYRVAEPDVRFAVRRTNYRWPETVREKRPLGVLVGVGFGDRAIEAGRLRRVITPPAREVHRSAGHPPPGRRSLRRSSARRT